MAKEWLGASTLSAKGLVGQTWNWHNDRRVLADGISGCVSYQTCSVLRTHEMRHDVSRVRNPVTSLVSALEWSVDLCAMFVALREDGGKVITCMLFCISLHPFPSNCQATPTWLFGLVSGLVPVLVARVDGKPNGQAGS